MLNTNLNYNTILSNNSTNIININTNKIDKIYTNNLLTKAYSFSCAGWLKMYLFGVAYFLQENDLINDNSKFIGSSAGALTATGLGLNINFQKVKNYVKNIILPKAHSNILGPFYARSYLLETLNKFLPLKNNESAINILNKKRNVTIVYTTIPSCRARRCDYFNTHNDLILSILASCCATPIAGLPFKLNNELIFDGGLSDFQPIIDKDTITISPFYCSNSDIHPTTYVPMWWAVYPPSANNIEWLFNLGYKDGYLWAYKNKFITIPYETTSHYKNNYCNNYNINFKTNIGRVFGYKDTFKLLDWLFTFCLIFLWKPLALSLVYIELAIRIIISFSKIIIFGIGCKLLYTLSTGSILPFTFFISAGGISSVSYIFILSLCTLIFGCIVVYVGGINKATAIISNDWNICLTNMRTIISISLLLRLLLPLIGNYIEIKRHQFLMQYSLIYRMINHFV